jgi:hypothetical protein
MVYGLGSRLRVIRGQGSSGHLVLEISIRLETGCDVIHRTLRNGKLPERYGPAVKSHALYSGRKSGSLLSWDAAYPLEI